MESFSPCALQRLQRDLTELYKEPLPGIDVHVDPSNISLMCLLLTPLEGPHCGLRLHLSVSIPPSYPHQPPEVSIETPIFGHPNIIGSYICCDILRRPNMFPTTDSSLYMGGYTPAYLLKYLFLQLLTFFSMPRIEQDYGGVISLGWSYGSYIEDFACSKCGFNAVAFRKGSRFEEEMENDSDYEAGTEYGSDSEEDTETKGGSKLEDEDSSNDKGLPSLEEAIESVCVQSPLSQTDAAMATLDQDHLHMLHDHVWLIIFNRLSDQDLINLGRASPTVAGDVLRRYNVALSRELVCFFTRKTFKEALLGVGLRRQEETPSHAASRSNATRIVLHIEAFDMLSFEAFDTEYVRRGICGHTFTHFLPLGLDDDHFTRAVPVLRIFLTDIGLTSDLSPTGFLYVITKLMNTMIVNMMKECDTPVTSSELDNEYTGDESGEAVSKRAILQASEKAFKGYCLLFHLLMKLSGMFPLIKAKAQEKLTMFFSGKEARNKKNIPDLGEFVAVLPLVLEEGYDWATLCSALVEELLARNVMWVLKEKPELAELGKDRSNQYIIPARRRLQDTFLGSRTGLRLMMLQANFMRALVQWRSKLNETYGFPPGEMAAHLVELVKRIYLVQGGKRDPYAAWKDFFTILQYEPIPSMLETVEMLKNAVFESKNKGYHRDAKFLGKKQTPQRTHGSVQPRMR